MGGERPSCPKDVMCGWFADVCRKDGKNTAKLTAEVLEMVRMLVEKQDLLIGKIDVKEQGTYRISHDFFRVQRCSAPRATNLLMLIL